MTFNLGQNQGWPLNKSFACKKENVYLISSHYKFMEMDTDSLYIAFADENIDNRVKLELQEKGVQVKWDWFSSEDQDTMVELISQAD